MPSSSGSGRAGSAEARRLRVELQGAVQGIGFRPFVYRLAVELGLSGWVVNDSRGVIVEVEGEEGSLSSFLERLKTERPRRSILRSVSSAWLPLAGFEGFEIRRSEASGEKTVLVLPDIATCDDCLRDLLDPANRRYRYPFTNCTNCGPRFTIVEALPYDRRNTTMRGFPMCPDCSDEYESPLDRRFHAQPNACPSCGPRLALWSATGEVLAAGEAALSGAEDALRRGSIVAMKGLGGFLLLADARSDEALAELRRRKRRPTKAFALMVRNLEMAASLVELDPAISAALGSPEAPIVLARRRPHAPLSEAVAPANPYLGLMLPYSPLHHLLARDLGFPLVATSGNLSEEPICTEESEALARLGGIADLFLVHDRPIARHADDSVAWVVRGELRLLRRARGFAPLPILLKAPVPTILGLGAQQKNCVALSRGENVFVSQHIGDLDNAAAAEAFERVIADFERLYGARPEALACDLSPDYVSSQWARARSEEAAEAGSPLPLIPVQHHHAHFAACLAENGHEGEALGVVWDGSGYGGDGTVWGGEFLLGNARSFARFAHLRPFRLIGGEAAVREPRRVALGLLWELYGEGLFGMTELPLVRRLEAGEAEAFRGMLASGFNSPLTSSAGRLFDGVAALLGFESRLSYEGEAAMALEFSAGACAAGASAAGGYAADASAAGAYRLGLVRAEGGIVLDWGPAIEALIADRRAGLRRGLISARFHDALSAAIGEIASEAGEEAVALSGGCFQNRVLLESASARLEAAGHKVLLHRLLPPNDGCICVGQVAVAAARLGEARISKEAR